MDASIYSVKKLYIRIFYGMHMAMKKLLVIGGVATLFKISALSTSLIIRRQLIRGYEGERITVNGTSPGPVLRLQKGVEAVITVVNEIYDAASSIHWHGMTQRGTPFSDGAIGFTQCPITNVMGSNTMVYKFTPEKSGTYWYHGHFGEQYPDGLVGAIVVSDTQEQLTLQNLGAAYDFDIDSFYFIAADYYAAPAHTLIGNYLSPASGGDEPMPDAFIVNGKRTNTLSVVADKTKIYRVRVVNAAAFSMFTITVDGMPLKIIEIDGDMVVPFSVSSFVVNAAQRVSFLLDFSQLNSTLQSSPAIWIRFTGIPDMYPTFTGDVQSELRGMKYHSSFTLPFVSYSLTIVNPYYRNCAE